MYDLIDTAYFGILISILAYELGIFFYQRSRISILNPLLISIVLIIAFLSMFNIDFGLYNKGGSIISLFLGPATVILAVPLYKHLDILKKNVLPIVVGVTVGCVSAITSIMILSRLLGLTEILETSLLPKSITTPIGMELSKQIGGNPSVTVLAILITGIFGAVIGPFVFKVFKIKDEVAMGLAMGTSSHAIGTTKAIELGEVQGGMSGLAIGLAGLTTVILVTLFI